MNKKGKKNTEKKRIIECIDNIKETKNSVKVIDAKYILKNIYDKDKSHVPALLNIRRKYIMNIANTLGYNCRKSICGGIILEKKIN